MLFGTEFLVNTPEPLKSTGAQYQSQIQYRSVLLHPVRSMAVPGTPEQPEAVLLARIHNILTIIINKVLFLRLLFQVSHYKINSITRINILCD